MFGAGYALLLGFLCGLAGFRIGWRLAHPVVLPLAQGALGWTAFAWTWRAHGPAVAAAAVGTWAVATTLISLYFFVPNPDETDRRVFRAKAYRATMLDWLRTGRGPEARPWATARQHLHELIVYVAAAVVSANVISLVMGAVLLNYMNAYVATLLRAATRRPVVAALGWNVWSLVRVAAYVAIGAAAASPLAAWLPWPGPGGPVAPLAVAGGAGVAADLVLKLALSRPCGRALAAAVDLDAAAENRRPAPPRFTMGLVEPPPGP